MQSMPFPGLRKQSHELPSVRTVAIAMAIAALFSGCATVKLAVTGIEPILILESAEIRNPGGRSEMEVTLPAGEYRPAIRDARGVYYRPPTDVIWRGQAMNHVMVYIPHDPSTPSALWLEGATATWDLKPRLDFKYKRTE